MEKQQKQIEEFIRQKEHIKRTGAIQRKFMEAEGSPMQEARHLNQQQQAQQLSQLKVKYKDSHISPNKHNDTLPFSEPIQI